MIEMAEKEQEEGDFKSTGEKEGSQREREKK